MLIRSSLFSDLTGDSFTLLPRADKKHHPGKTRPLSSPLPNQAGNSVKYIHHSLRASLGRVQDVFWVPCQLTKSYLSRAALGQPVWAVNSQQQESMTEENDIDLRTCS